MLKWCSESLGSSAVRCPNLSEKVLGSRAESRAERFSDNWTIRLGSALGRTSQKFWTSARPSVGQSKKICPNADPCSKVANLQNFR
jgi:hypothetical protein